MASSGACLLLPLNSCLWRFLTLLSRLLAIGRAARLPAHGREKKAADVIADIVLVVVIGTRIIVLAVRRPFCCVLFVFLFAVLLRVSWRLAYFWQWSRFVSSWSWFALPGSV